MASEKQEHEWTYPGNYRHKERFEFPYMKDKIGFFIIDFIGNGLNKRAII